MHGSRCPSNVRVSLSVFAAYENQPWKSFCSSNAEQRSSQLFTNRASIILFLLLCPHQLCILYIKYLTFAHPLICIISRVPVVRRAETGWEDDATELVSFTSSNLPRIEGICVYSILCCRQRSLCAYKPMRKHVDINALIIEAWQASA